MKKIVNILTVVGGMGLIYMAGKCSGVFECMKATSEVLEKDHQLKINKVTYGIPYKTPLKGHFKVSVSKLEKEEAQ